MLDGHLSSVDHAAWSPDGKRVATASVDKSARVWSADGADGHREPVDLDAGAPIIALIFREDGEAILGVGADDTTSSWTIGIKALRKGLVAASTDCLPVEMRVTYLGEPADEADKKYTACEAAHGPPDLVALADEPLASPSDTVQPVHSVPQEHGSDARPPALGAGGKAAGAGKPARFKFDE